MKTVALLIGCVRKGLWKKVVVISKGKKGAFPEAGSPLGMKLY